MRPSSALGWALATAGILLAGVLALASTQPGSTDDAFVLLVQARGLLGGAGWEVQVGEGAVESVTSLLDLALKAVALGLSPASGETTLWRTNVALYLALLAACALVPKGGGRWGVAVGALVLCPGLAEGASYMLETPLYLALLLWAAHVVLRRAEGFWPEVTAAVAASSLLLARPEGVVVAGVFLAGRARMVTGASRWRPALAVAAVAGALLAWRLMTFGTWAPNSFFAKRSDSSLNELMDGVNYVVASVMHSGRPGPLPEVTVWLSVAPLLLIALAGPWIASRRPDGEPGLRLAVLAWATTASLLAVVVSGGDGYRGLRLLAPVFWLSTLTLVELSGSSCRRSGVWGASLLAVVFGARLVEVLPNAGSKLEDVARAVGAETPWDSRPQEALATGLELALSGEVIAHRHSQAMKYYAPSLRVMDMTGLTQPTIAHQSAPGPVGFGRDALSWALEQGVGAIHLDALSFRGNPAHLHDLGALAKNPKVWEEILGPDVPQGATLAQLVQDYRCASLSGVAGPGTWANCLIRIDLAQDFRAAGFDVYGP
ncbi:MAG: hypothetical protein ABGY29_08235 [bacterium]